MLVIHYARHAFPGLKSIKNFGPPTLRLGPPTLNALASALFALKAKLQVLKFFAKLDSKAC